MSRRMFLRESPDGKHGGQGGAGGRASDAGPRGWKRGFSGPESAKKRGGEKIAYICIYLLRGLWGNYIFLISLL